MTIKSVAEIVGAPSLASDGVHRIPIIEESLHVDVKEVVRGGIRITKTVHSHEQLVDELLRSEEVTVERRPMNTVLADGFLPIVREEGDTLVVPVIKEVLVTVKQLVLVEEVHITRTKGTHRTPQTYTLRKDHIEIQRLSDEHSSSDELF